jgi:hypothetical protein
MPLFSRVQIPFVLVFGDDRQKRCTHIREALVTLSDNMLIKANVTDLAKTVPRKTIRGFSRDFKCMRLMYNDCVGDLDKKLQTSL